MRRLAFLAAMVQERITRSHLSLLEAGHRKNPSPRALGVPVGELLE